MKRRYIIQEKHHGRTVPLAHKGLFCGRRLARVAAKAHGYPPQLIKQVSK